MHESDEKSKRYPVHPAAFPGEAWLGFDPNTAIFFSGIGTIIFFLIVGGRVPSYLGSSFSFIAVVATATAYSAKALGTPNPHTL